MFTANSPTSGSTGLTNDFYARYFKKIAVFIVYVYVSPYIKLTH